jgi:ribosome biogenesis GTPase A
VSSLQGPTTTSLSQEVTLETGEKRIRLIDTPGFLWDFTENQSTEFIKQGRARDILLRNRGRIDRLKDPSLPGMLSLPFIVEACISSHASDRNCTQSGHGGSDASI